MPFACHLSTDDHDGRALDEVVAGAASFPGPADLAVLFYSAHPLDRLPGLVDGVHKRLAPRWLLGCPGETVIGNDREVEQRPALALGLGRWSKPIQITPFHLTVEETSEGHSLLGWPDALADADPAGSLLLTLADPFTFPIDAYLGRVNADRPGLAVVGGMASAAMQPGQNLLVHGNEIVRHGAVGVLLQGPVGFRSVVSQGCRPIGKPLVITKAQENVILELGGKPALAQLQAIWQELPEPDKELLRQGVHLGRVINEYQETFQRGDFLVRNVVGLDRTTGALAITDRVRVGQTVQFHLRDARTADEDLRFLLHNAPSGPSSRGGLLFSCNGRGARLFDEPNHDAAAVQQAVGPLPLAGFSAQGELGPIGGQNFIHGYTASLVLFED